MVALFVALDGKMTLMEIPDRFKGNSYQISDKLPVSIRPGEWMVPIRGHIRTFVWRFTTSRKNSEPIFDLFEEIESGL